jgi:hypothetical protein
MIATMIRAAGLLVPALWLLYVLLRKRKPNRVDADRTSQVDEPARALLASANIPAYLTADPVQVTHGAGGVRLLVPAPSLEQARALLRTRVSDDELAAEAERGCEAGQRR